MRVALRVFHLVLRFSSLHKNQHLQIPVRSGNSGCNSHLVDSTEINMETSLALTSVARKVCFSIENVIFGKRKKLCLHFS